MYCKIVLLSLFFFACNHLSNICVTLAVVPPERQQGKEPFLSRPQKSTGGFLSGIRQRLLSRRGGVDARRSDSDFFGDIPSERSEQEVEKRPRRLGARIRDCFRNFVRQKAASCVASTKGFLKQVCSGFGKVKEALARLRGVNPLQREFVRWEAQEAVEWGATMATLHAYFSSVSQKVSKSLSSASTTDLDPDSSDAPLYEPTNAFWSTYMDDWSPWETTSNETVIVLLTAGDAYAHAITFDMARVRGNGNGNNGKGVLSLELDNSKEAQRVKTLWNTLGKRIPQPRFKLEILLDGSIQLLFPPGYNPIPLVSFSPDIERLVTPAANAGSPLSSQGLIPEADYKTRVEYATGRCATCSTHEAAAGLVRLFRAGVKAYNYHIDILKSLLEPTYLRRESFYQWAAARQFKAFEGETATEIDSRKPLYVVGINIQPTTRVKFCIIADIVPKLGGFKPEDVVSKKLCSSLGPQKTLPEELRQPGRVVPYRKTQLIPKDRQLITLQVEGEGQPKPILFVK